FTLNTPVAESSSYSGQTGNYTFSGTANEVINLSISGINSCNTTYTIVKPDGSTLVSNWSCSSQMTFSNQTLPSTGTYTLKIVSPYNSYSNTIVLTNPINSTLALNTPIGVSSQYTGQTGNYTFSGTANEVIDFAATGVNSCNTNYYVLKPDGSTLTSGWSCSNTLVFQGTTLPSTGIYTLSIVSPYTTYSNTLTLTNPITSSITYNTPINA